jgi:hypothetical protein
MGASGTNHGEPLVNELISPLFVVKDPSCLIQFCVMFEHRLTGNAELSLALNDQQQVVKMISNGFFEHYWQPESVTMANTNETLLAFRAKLTDGTVQIRNIRIHVGACDSRTFMFHECTFEQGTCGFGLSRGQPSFRLARGSAVIDPISGKGINDHTTHSTEGHLWSVDLLSQQITADKPNSIEFSMFNQVTSESAVCVRMWIVINARVTVQWFQDRRIIQTVKQEEPDSNWYPWQATVPILLQRLHISFQVNTDSKSNGYVGIDDVSVERGTCPGALHDCDFEQTCLWEQLENQIITIMDFNQKPIQVNSHGAFKRSTAESIDFAGGDHTFGENSGHLLQLKEVYETLVIRSPKILLSDRNLYDTFCFEFWFKYRPETSADKVTFKLAAGLNNQTEIHLIQFAPIVATSDWTAEHVQISVPKLHDRFKKQRDRENADWKVQHWSIVLYLIIESELQFVDLLLDDFRWLTNTCPTEHDAFKAVFRCEQDKSIVLSIDRKCDSIADCADSSDELECGQCTFGQGHLCGYRFVSKESSILYPIDLKAHETFLKRSVDNEYDADDVSQKSKASSSFLNMYSELRLPVFEFERFLFARLWTLPIDSCAAAVSPTIRATALHSSISFKYASLSTRMSVSLLRGTALNGPYDHQSPLTESSNDVDPDILTVWSSQADQLTAVGVTLQLGRISRPTRIRWLFCRLDLDSKSQAFITELQREAPLTLNELQVTASETNVDKAEEEFDCGDGSKVNRMHVCDQRKDCDNGRDELYCLFDRQALDFNSNLPDFVSTVRMSHSLVNQQSSTLNFLQSDHSNKASIGGVLWISSADRTSDYGNEINLDIEQFKVSSEDKLPQTDDASNLVKAPLVEEKAKSRVIGHISGFRVLNQHDCRVRLHYQLNGSTAILQLITRDWLEQSANKLMHSTTLTQQSSWKRLEFPLFSTKVAKQFRLRVQLQIDRKDTTIALDDISFTSDCYTGEQDSLSTLVTGRSIGKDRLGDWHMIKTNEYVSIEAAMFQSPLIATAQTIKQGWSNVLLALLVNPLQEHQEVTLESKLLDRTTVSSDLLSFKYGLIGGGHFRVQLIESISGFELFERSEFSSGAIEEALIPLPVTDENTFGIRLHIQFESSNIQLLIQDLNIAKNDHIIANSSIPCSFDQSADCLFFSRLSKSVHFARVAGHGFLADHTLNTRHGGHLLAGCGLNAARQFANTLETRHLDAGLHLISFWFTTFWKGDDSSVDPSKSSWASGGSIRITNLYNQQSPWLEFKDNLQGRWNRALVHVWINPTDEIRVQAILDESNSLYCVAIDDFFVKSFDTKSIDFDVECDFGQGKFCAWSNEGFGNQIRWEPALSDVQNQSLDSSPQYVKSVFEPQILNKSAVLVTPWMQPVEQTVCLKVKLRTSNPAVKLSVQINVAHSLNDSINLITITDLKAKWEWKSVEINPSVLSKVQRIIIKSSLIGLNPSVGPSSIDISRIKLYRKACSDRVEKDELEIDKEKLQTNINRSNQSIQDFSCKFFLIFGFINFGI